ncbi:MAG: cellulase family glycosylhydrolase, partial [Mycobacterium sp.]
MGEWMHRVRRRYAAKFVVAIIAVAVPCAAASQLLPNLARSTSYDVVPTAAIDETKGSVGISEPYLSYNLGDVDETIEDMVGLGVTNVRIQIPWNFVETAPGVYNWDLVDDIVEKAHAANLGILGIISHTPAWAGNGGVNAQPDPAVYANFAKEVAERYAGEISAYEIWNEPNAALFLNPIDPVAYTHLLQAAYTAIKGVDPSITVVGGVVSSAGNIPGFSMTPQDFVAAMYAAGAKGWFDALSFHPYAYPLGTEFTAGAGYSGSAYEQLAALREVMLANSDDKLIWATEFGVPTAGGITEEQQATVITNFLTAWNSLGYTGPMFIHTMTDLATGTNSYEDNFGIYFDNGDPKLAAAAIAAWIAAHPPPVVNPPISVNPGDPFVALSAVIQAFLNNASQAFQNLSQSVSTFFTQTLAGFMNSIVTAIAQIFNPPSATANQMSVTSNEDLAVTSRMGFSAEAAEGDNPSAGTLSEEDGNALTQEGEEGVATEPSVATELSVTTEPSVTTEQDDPVTTEPVTTETITTEPITTEPITTEPITTEPVTTDP